MKRIVIVIEVVNRELDNALLLKCVLEKRGYKVKILSKTEQISIKKTDILIIPNCYNTENYEFYRYRFNCKSGQIVSMQYEQVLAKYSIKNGFYNPKGRAKDVVQLCWGSNSYERMLQYGVDKKKIEIVGAIQLDTTRQQFDRMFKTKNELAKEYHIDIEKKWILYISSFSCAQENLIQDRLREVFDEERVLRFKKVSAISQKYTLDWFDEFLTINDEYVVIYRPHPVELNSKSISDLRKKYPDKFKCIYDLGIKQWIKVSDIVSTWFSTSIVESYMMKKNCLIFRPVEIDEEDECEIYYGCNSYKTYDDMTKSILNYANTLEQFPIDKDEIFRHYDEKELPTYERIADYIKQMEGDGNKEEKYDIHRIRYMMKNNIYIKILLKKSYQLLYKKFHFRITNEKIRNKFFIEEWEKSIDNLINNKSEIDKKLKILKEII